MLLMMLILTLMAAADADVALKGVECLNQINVSERITNCLCTVAVSEHRLTPTGLAF